MTQWADVAIAVGPAAITGVLGYCAARLSAAIAIRQTTAEADRLRMQWDEGARTHRQNYYHQAAMALERMRRALETTAQFSQGELFAWLEQWRPIFTGVAVFGTTAARDAVEQMNRTIDDVADTIDPNAPFQPAEDMRNTHPNLMGRFESDYRRLLEGMRADVAPHETGES